MLIGPALPGRNDDRCRRLDSSVATAPITGDVATRGWQPCRHERASCSFLLEGDELRIGAG